MKPTSILLVLLALVSSIFAQTRDHTRWVNPFIGTGGHGHTFPGATMPFGMVQLSPDTRIDNWDGSSGYHYSDDIIYGFSHTHLSGTGIPDGADILLRPSNEWPIRTKFTKFSHGNELAEPGFYSVRLDDGILAELTSTTRVGFHRYTFPKQEFASITLDLSWRDRLLGSDISFVDPKTITGFRRSSSWAKNQAVYFAIEFSIPYEMNSVSIRNHPDEKVGTNVGFKLASDERLLVKVAISYVSIEGARKNLQAELPHWDFDKVRADAKAAWNKELSKIDVSGGTDEQTTNFYTALYHTMIHPNVFNDIDGRYKGHDGRVHSTRSADTPVRIAGASGETVSADRGLGAGRARSRRSDAHADKSVRAPSEQYTVFSLWDTFRAAHPLYTIIDQKRTVDYINSFLRIYEQGGRLPVWELWGEETDTMIGYHSVSVIADAMAKGIEGFDYEKAYAAAKHSANLDHHGLAAYKKRGYVSGEDDNESVSKTLEYAYNDWCIARMAEDLIRIRQNANRAAGKPENDDYVAAKIADHKLYIHRARSFENLFDAKTKFFRPKRNADFVSPFRPNEVTFHFTEGNSWQYSFFVPHDVSRLTELMGGRQQFIHKLDELFETEQKLAGRHQPDITGLIGQYAHGNEPSHHIPYLYNYAHAPSKTQARVRYILDNFYKNAPDGLIGNEDCGQMSAWYVLSASGFYSTVPGQSHYDLGTPLFKEVKFNLENGKTYTIKAPNVSEKNIYIKSSKWNGKPNHHSYIRHEEIMWGGVLELEMSDQPNDKAFIRYSNQGIFRDYLPVPVITGERVFTGGTNVYFSVSGRHATRVHFTTDGTEPTADSEVYTSPLHIEKTTTVKAVAIDEKNNRSFPVEARFQRRSNDWTVKLFSEYNSQYPGNGDETIIDGLRGNANFAAGEWQGFWGRPFEAVIDLQRETEIKEVGGSFLQSARSWIWMPDRLEFEVSNDGTSFTKIADWKPGFPQQEMNGTPKEFLKTVTPVRARFVRVRAYNFGKIPSWHVGAGGDPWIFVDEIFIR